MLTGVEIMGKPVNVESYIVQLTIDVAGGSVSFYEEGGAYPSDFIGTKVKFGGDCGSYTTATATSSSSDVYTCAASSPLTLTGESAHINLLLANFTFSPAANLNRLTATQPSLLFKVTEYDVRTRVSLSATTYMYTTIDLAPVNDVPSFSGVPAELHLLEEELIFPFKGTTAQTTATTSGSASAHMSILHDDLEEASTNLKLVLTVQCDHGHIGMSVDATLSQALYATLPLTHMTTHTTSSSMVLTGSVDRLNNALLYVPRSHSLLSLLSYLSSLCVCMMTILTSTLFTLRSNHSPTLLSTGTSHTRAREISTE